MTDIAAISGVVSSINGIKTIAEGILAARDISVVSGKVIELQSKIIEAQQGLFELQEDRRVLLERVSWLEKQITEFEDWEIEKQRYELVEASTGAFAYMEKLSDGKRSPPHWLCTNCFENRKKSVFQSVNAGSLRVYQCTPCGTKSTTPYDIGPKDTKRM